jgi:hypothetical protein
MTTTKVNLANTVEGILPVANGGTGTSTGVAPGGSTTQVQFNNAGAFGGSANLTFNGTTLTAAALTSTGVATFSAGTVSAPAITTTGDTNTGIFFPAADTIAFTEGGAEAMRINSSGDVGIGTTTPSSYGKFGVISGSNYVSLHTSTAQVMSQFNGAVSVAHIRMTYPAVADWDILSGSAGQLSFSGNSSERMRIDSSGNVGIGTTSPSGRLQVETSGSAANLFVRSDISTSALASRVLLGNSAGTARLTMGLLGGGGEVGFFGSEGSFPIYFQTNGTERMRITSGGNVGIGTTNPGARFEVAGTTTSTTMQITTTTGAPFTTYRNTGQDFYVGLDNSAGASFGSQYSANLYGTGAYPMLFWTNGTERLRIASNGALGIGGANYGSSGQVLTSNGSGSAPSWSTPTVSGTAKAWVYYNQASQTILGSFNVSSVTYNGTGLFRVNLTTALADTNFAVCGAGAGGGGAGVPTFTTFSETTGTGSAAGTNSQRTTSGANFRTARSDNDSPQDNLVSVIFFR